MRKNTNKSLFLITSLMVLSCSQLAARSITLHYANRDAAFVVKDTSTVRMGAGIEQAWVDSAVVKDIENEGAFSYAPTTFTTANAMAPLVWSNSNTVNIVYKEIEDIEFTGITDGHIVQSRVDDLYKRIRYNSNTILHVYRTHSDAIRYNSNALEYRARMNSNALLYTYRTTSNALEYRARINSNALMHNYRVNSNALEYRARMNSNALMYTYRINSNAIIHTAETLDALVGIEHDQMQITVDTTVDNIRFIKNGFMINDGTTLTLNTPLRVSGALQFGDHNGGALNLNGDLQLATDAYFSNGGTIRGNGHTINLNGDQEIPGILHFTSDTIVEGNGNTITFDGGSLMVEDAVSVTLRNMIIKLPSSDELACASALSSLSLDNVTLCLEDQYTFDAGRLFIDNTVVMRKAVATRNGYPGDFVHSSDSAITILPNSCWFFETGCNFCYNPPVANRDLLRFADVSSQLFLNGCSLYSTPTGMRLSKGSVVVDGKNYIYAEGESLSEAVAFGNNESGEELAIHILPGASIAVESGCLDYSNLAVG